jgi:hypothetical protein
MSLSRNLGLRHQLHVALRANPSPRLRIADRALWVGIHRLWPRWREHLVIVKPETVLRWHRKGLAAVLDVEIANQARVGLGSASRSET